MHPAVQRGGGVFQSEVGILPDLAVFGQMVSLFVYHYLREHVGGDVVDADDRMKVPWPGICADWANPCRLSCAIMDVL